MMDGVLEMRALRMVLVGALASSGCDQVFGLDHSCDGHDEDADGVADVCDNCPTVANPDQSDDLEVMNHDLADGVGDACDPAPGQSGDHIAIFDAFADPLAARRWVPSTGTWAFDGEALTYTPGNSDDLMLYQLAQPRGPLRLEYHVVIDGPVPDGISSTVRARVDGDATHDGVQCGLSRLDDPTWVDEVHATYDGGAPPFGSAEVLPVAFAVGHGYDVAMSYDPAAAVTCGARADLASGTGVTAQLALSSTPAAGSLGFVAYGFAFRLEHVIVYDRP